MRRKDREVTDREKIKDIVGRCSCCRLGFQDEGGVYIVPLSFGFTEKEGAYTFYFHGANKGRKLELMERNPVVGFELDTNYKINEDELACEYSARFQSVIGTGRAALVTDEKERRVGLGLIMEHVTGRGDWEFDENMLRKTAVFKVEVQELACKEHL